jgi:hypothetical protein
MNAQVMIREAGCKGSVLLSRVNTIKAHETSLKNRLAKVERMLGMDVNENGIPYKNLDSSQQSECYKTTVELAVDIKQALIAVSNVKAIKLIAKVDEVNLCYIHTTKFVEQLSEILTDGLSDDLCIEYIKNNTQFDTNGMDKGTDYSNTCIAFTKPEIHEFFKFSA